VVTEQASTAVERGLSYRGFASERLMAECDDRASPLRPEAVQGPPGSRAICRTEEPGIASDPSPISR
jgi:hypothetical protein